jgi:hypothetical protein
MIGHMPLWLVVVIWALQRRTQPRVTIYSYPAMHRLLSDMRMALPLPQHGTPTYWLVCRALAWIDREDAALCKLARMGVVASGSVPVSQN